MAAPPPPRRRPRRGSLERPVNARMYRGTWLLVGLPLLVAAFTVARPAPLPAPSLPPTFDTSSAQTLAESLTAVAPDRSPGSRGARQATAWVTDRFRTYGFRPRVERFAASVPGHGTTQLANVL